MLTPVPFGRYLLTDKIATGGMAEIFLAKLLGAEGFEKRVVVKRILPAWAENSEFVSMLIDEAKISVRLNHANIVQVYELTRQEGTLGIAMEHIDGIDLRRVMQKLGPGKKIPLEIGLYIVAEILQGLAYAHNKKDEEGRGLEIVHRDISPQNILLSWEGNVKLTDFGIAKAASRSHETVAGVLKGKFAYMSPEQASQGAIDKRSDLFSAGIILYEVVTGERLFGKGSDLDTLERVRRAQINFSPDVKLPPALKEILLQALAKRREDRYQDATPFREAIVQFSKKSKRQLTPQKLALFLTKLFGEGPRQLGSNQPASKEGMPQTVAVTQELTRSLEEPRPLLPPFSPTVLIPATTKKWPSIKGWQSSSGWMARLTILAIGVFIFAALFSVLRPARRVEKNKGLVSAPVVTNAPVLPVTEPEVQPQVQGGQVIGLAPAAPAEPSQAESATAPSLPPVPGYLNVQAIPWGMVTVSGQGPLETPVRRIKLAEGTHNLHVSYEPDGTELSTRVTVRGGKEVTCIASFRGEKGIRCRD